MYSKIILDLFAIDETCAQRITDAWKADLSVTRRLKNDRPYTSLEEYVPFRTWDAGTRLVSSLKKLKVAALTISDSL